MDLIQRRGSSLELKSPSTQIVVQINIQLLFFGQRITVESYFHGTSSEPEKCLFYLSGLGISCPSIVKKKGEKIGITRFDLRVIES